MALIQIPVKGQGNVGVGGELVYGESETVTRLNPYEVTAARGVSDRLFALLYEGLARYDFDSDKTVAALAKSWEILPQNSGILFHLRPNIFWHDGVRFTAGDVKFTYEFVKLNEGVQEQVKRRFDFIESIDLVDSLTVRFSFSQPKLNAIDYFDAWIIPQHQFDNNVADKTATIAQKVRNPVGTGPYVFKRRTLDGHVTLHLNRNYWGNPGHISRLKMRNIPDQGNLINNLIYDSIRLVIETPPTDIARLESIGKFNLQPYQSFSIHVFAYNNLNPVLADPIVRKALTMATDRAQLLEQWYAGKGSILFGPFVPSSAYFNPELSPMPHNPRKARQLLQNAGYRDIDGDGILERILDGTKLSFNLIIQHENVATSTVLQNVAESFVNYARAIGIEVKSDNMVLDDYLESLFIKHDYDIALTKWTFGTSYDISDLFYSKDNYPGGNNIISYANPKVDILLDEYRKAKDRDRRRSIIYSLQEILREDCPYTFLYTIDNYATIHYAITNVRIDPYYFFTFFAQWYISPEFQD